MSEARAAVSIRGRLVDETGAIIDSATQQVSARDRAGIRFSPDQLGGGTFEFRALEPGPWWIWGDAVGFEETQLQVVLPRSDAPLEVDLVLRRRPLVRVKLLTPSGEVFLTSGPRSRFLPVLYATREAPGDPDDLGPERRSECGELSDRQLVDRDAGYLGLLEVTCELPIWASLVVGRTVLALERVEPGMDEIVFRLDPAEHARWFTDVRMRVVDGATGVPAGGVLVHMKAGDWHGWTNLVNRSGELEFEGVPVGPASLAFTGSGYEDRTLEFEVSPGTVHDLGEVELSAAGRSELRLEVVRPAGVDEVSVAWCTASEGAPPGWTTQTWREGEEIVITLGAGRWLVWAEASDGERRFRSHDLEIAIDGGVVAEALALEPLAQVVLRSASGERTVTIVDRSSRASTRRSYVVRGYPVQVELIEGEYDLLVSGGDGEERRIPLHVGSEGASVELN